jgi:hypothetical protein
MQRNAHVSVGHSVDLTELSTYRLADMSAAADEVLEALRVLGKAGTNPVAQVLRHQGDFLELDHYPKGDVYDEETGSQYYYHAHRSETGEHGHFHVFMRAGGMSTGVEPMPYTGREDRPLGSDAIAHLIAISMDRTGLAVGLFTTNRWVTGETFYAAPDAIAMLDRFEIDHAYPCLATNRWITALLRLFRPHIEVLLWQRDERIFRLQRQHPDVDVFEDRSFEIMSELKIDIDEQAAHVDAALNRRLSDRASLPLQQAS